MPSIASEWLTTQPLGKHRLSSSVRRQPYAQIHTHTLTEARICSAAHTPTHSAAHSLSKSLTVPRTLIYTSSPNSRHLPLLWMPPAQTVSLTLLSHSSNCFSCSLSTSPTPALTASTKFSPQARSVESVGGVRCWHFPPPLLWARLQHRTACSLPLSHLAPLLSRSASYGSRRCVRLPRPRHSTTLHPKKDKYWEGVFEYGVVGGGGVLSYQNKTISLLQLFVK